MTSSINFKPRKAEVKEKAKAYLTVRPAMEVLGEP
jgi:hypothetical protein